MLRGNSLREKWDDLKTLIREGRVDRLDMEDFEHEVDEHTDLPGNEEWDPDPEALSIFEDPQGFDLDEQETFVMEGVRAVAQAFRDGDFKCMAEKYTHLLTGLVIKREDPDPSKCPRCEALRKALVP